MALQKNTASGVQSTYHPLLTYVPPQLAPAPVQPPMTKVAPIVQPQIPYQYLFTLFMHHYNTKLPHVPDAMRHGGHGCGCGQRQNGQYFVISSLGSYPNQL